MSGWQERRLGDALAVRHGFAFKGEHFRDAGARVVLTPGNFNDGGGFKAKSGTEKFYEGPVPEGYVLSQGDVVVAMTEQAAGLLGSTATIPSDGTYLHNQRIGLVRITDPDLLDLRFVYHLFNCPAVRAEIQATATGSKVRHTAPERIENVKARVPGVTVQRRIAEVLDAIDDLRENNRRRIELLEQLAQAIYQEWFVRFRYPGHENDELVDLGDGPIPSGWNWEAFEAVCSAETTSCDPASIDEATPAVGLEHLGRRTFTLTSWGTAGGLASRKLTFRRGDVLFGKIRPYFHKVSLAPVDGICSSDAIVLRARERRTAFVLLTAFSDEFVAHAVTTSNGTKMPRADWRVLRGWRIPKPPEDVARLFEETLAPVLRLSVVLMEQVRALGAARDLLLPRMVTGEIDVSTLDVDQLVGEATG